MSFPKNREDSYKAAIARIHGKNGAVVGTGFLVNDNYLLTCAHVIAVALGCPLMTKEIPSDQKVTVDFPFSSANPEKIQTDVVFWEPVGEHKTQGDIAGLRLHGQRPSSVRAIPLVMSASQTEHYRDHRFHVFGFPSGHKQDGSWAKGEMQSSVIGRRVQIQAFQEEGIHVEPGFSGAPIWDEALNGVVGMIAAYEQIRVTSRTAYMIPYGLLEPALDTLDLLGYLFADEAQLSDSIHEAYQICRRDRAQFPRNPETLPSKLDSLRNMPNGHDEIPCGNLRYFAGCLTLAELDAPQLLQRTLKDWLQQRLGDRLLDMVLDDLRSRAQQRMDNQRDAQTNHDIVPHLLISVDTFSLGEGYQYPVNAVFVRDPSQYDYKTGRGCDPINALNTEPFEGTATLKSLPKIIRRCLQEVSALLYSRNEIELIVRLKIDIFLPLPWLGHSVDQCSTEDIENSDEADSDEDDDSDTIGSTYCVVIRSSDRLAPRYLAQRGFWFTKWNTLGQLTDCRISDRNIFAIVTTEPNLGVLQGQLMAEATVGLGMNYAPSTKLLRKIIKAGTPVAIWIRQELCDSAPQAPQINEILDWFIYELLPNVKQKRLGALGRTPTHIGHHLSLLWENPLLIPPEKEDQEFISRSA